VKKREKIDTLRQLAASTTMPDVKRAPTLLEL